MSILLNFRGLVSVLLFIAGFVVPCRGQASKPTILEMPVYRSVGQLWLDENGQLQGVRMKLLRSLNRELASSGIQFKYRITDQGELPIVRCIKELVEGEYDAYLGLGESEDRRKLGVVYSSEPLYTVPNVIWMYKDRIFQIRSHQDLKGKRIGVLQGGPLLTGEHHEEDMIIDRSATHPKQNLQKLVHDRLDLIVDPLTRTGSVVVEEHLQEQIRFCLYCLPPSKAFVAFSPYVPASVRDKIDEAIRRLQISGEIQHLLVGKVLEELEGSQIDTP